MTEVYRRKLALDKYTPTLTAVTLFYSRIILKKLTTENKTIFRKLEKSVKFCVKCDADIKFNKMYCKRILRNSLFKEMLSLISWNIIIAIKL